MIALVAAAGLTLVLAFTLVRLFAGPTLHDRLLAVISATVKAALIAAALAAASGRGAGVDAALALMLGTLVLAVAALKFFRARTFQAPLARGAERT